MLSFSELYVMFIAVYERILICKGYHNCSFFPRKH